MLKTELPNEVVGGQGLFMDASGSCSLTFPPCVSPGHNPSLWLPARPPGTWKARLPHPVLLPVNLCPDPSRCGGAADPRTWPPAPGPPLAVQFILTSIPVFLLLPQECKSKTQRNHRKFSFYSYPPVSTVLAFRVESRSPRAAAAFSRGFC